MQNILKLLVLLFPIILFSCEDKVLEPYVKDPVAPGIIEIRSVTPLPGGLRIEYNLPDDKDLLYVKAVYSLVGGATAEVKASYYDNKLDVLGFGDTLEHKITFYAVDRSENLSLAVETKGFPLKAPVKLIEETLNISANFGGARFKWVNDTEAAVSILIFGQDTITGELVNVHTIYTSQKSSYYNLRGYKPVSGKFAAIVRDRWDNFSDTISITITPWAESFLDKEKFTLVTLQNDTPWDAWGFSTENVFDGDLQSSAHTQGDHAWPQILTIDLGVIVQLSRVTVYQRSGDGGTTGWLYTHGNPKRYDFYGALTLPDNTGDLSKWTKLRLEECVSLKPSGDGPLSDEDIQHGFAGDEYDCEPIEIRYFRFAVSETWDGAGFINFNELSFWGSIKELGKKK